MAPRCARPLAAGLAAAVPLVAELRGRRRRGLVLCDAGPAQDTRVQLAALREDPGSQLDVRFQNMHKKGLVEVGDWYPVTLFPPMTARLAFCTLRYYMNIIRPSVTVTVRDARKKEAEEGLSKAQFFERHGFVLLQRATAMSAADWNESAPDTLGLPYLTGDGMRSLETPLSRIYAREVEQIIRELLPDSTELELDPLVVRRGPGTRNPIYNFAPHQDYGFTADDWPGAGPEFRKRFEQPEVRGLMVLNFWRPVLPMRGPVKKTPLAVCDPSSVKIEDIVPVKVRRDDKGYVKMLDLAYDQDQQWYYYPDMTVDEVLVFKSFQYFKSQTGRELNTCFHTAFEHPAAPPGAEERQSCEYRARIWF